MNRLLFFLFCMIFFVAAKGQRNYNEAIKQGDDAFNRKEYKTAINKYFAAEAFDPTKKDSVKAKVNRAFDAIESLRKKAEADKIRAEIAERKANEQKRLTEAAKNEAIKSDSATKVALTKSKKLIDAFYFYADRFALAFKNERFYFIDKNGDEVTRLGKWEKADQFEKSGFAKVKKQYDFNKITVKTFTDSAGDVIQMAKTAPKIVIDDSNYTLIDHLLDTSGSSYPAAFDFNNNNDHKIKVGIKALDLTSKHFDSFPLDVLQYHDLQVLILNGWLHWHNSFVAIPSGINKLPYLFNLQLEACSIKNLPNEIGELKKLEKLVLGFNELDSLPKEIGSLENLKILELIKNNLISLPNEIGHLKNLVSIDLEFNKIIKLPNEIGQLKNLTTLKLSGNQLDSLPKEIGHLENLTTLSLSGNQLDSLPKEIGQLENLIILDLSYNELKSLPKGIGQLKNLTTLNLSSNHQLKSLPKEIAGLKNLTTLDLNYTRLSSLPKEIGQLKNLTTLCLSINQLESLPKEIDQLKKLVTLELIGTRVPETEIKKIEKLLPGCNIITFSRPVPLRKLPTPKLSQ